MNGHDTPNRRNSSPNRALSSGDPVFSWRRPWWLLVLGVMLGFGLLQEQSKIKVNHYLRMGDAANFWDNDAENRRTWWDAHAPIGRHNFYVSRTTWSLFHGLTRQQMVAFKWGMSAAILFMFFLLDVMLLRATQVGERVPWLLLIYAAAGMPLVGLAFSKPGEAWYALARDMLGFLQSPLPSLLVVLVPLYLDRMNVTSDASD